MPALNRLPARQLVGTGLAALLALCAAGAALVAGPADDFLQPGTQPGGLTDPIQSAYSECAVCHAGYDSPDNEQDPFTHWAVSMKGQAMRDPVFHAALDIANQDVAEAGQLCLRCHTPSGFLEGRTVGAPDGSLLTAKDYEGVSCNVCHRLVDPFADPANPAADGGILAALASAPVQAENGQYVIDPDDVRRGPFDLLVQFPAGFFLHNWAESPFHQEALLCATCHDVSNPAMSRSGGAVPAASDTYALNTANTEHPTGEGKDMFPIERTYSEWANSDFAAAPIDMGGLFGGNKVSVSSCQDCHMPDITGTACNPALGGAIRNDLPRHDFNGANSWVPLAIDSLDQKAVAVDPNRLYEVDKQSQAGTALFQEAVDRNVSMLERASDITLSQDGESLGVRITNNTGHKLPTGYPEGRRMWVNVQFYDATDALVGEHGAYDDSTATLTTGDTKVYEAKQGVDAAQALATGLPEGETFHFALNNAVVLDNRIPPRGFTNAAFEAVQAQPVAYTYADGQYWDDTDFEIPCDAVRAEVRFYAQTTTKEYIEFLRDNATSPPPDVPASLTSVGQIAYDEWVAAGKSAPVEMDSAMIDLVPRISGDKDTLSISAGDKLTLCLNAGLANGNQLYWTLGSATGTGPTPLPGVSVPLTFDAYFNFTLVNPNAPPLKTNVGFLSPTGMGTSTFKVPNSAGSLAGVTAYHAFVVIDAFLGIGTASSNVHQVDLVP